MKKSLLALAVLGAFASVAQAQTNVSIGGVVQANAKAYKVSNTVRPADTEYRIDDDYNSRFWLTGTEDLGGGLSALFYIENRLNTDMGAGGTGSGIANGDTFVGLKGGFGQLTLGRHSMLSVQGLTTEILTGTGTIVAMPTSMFATYTILNSFNGTGLDITRRNNSLMYRSPNISGFSASVGISASSTTSEGQLAAAPVANYADGREYYVQAGYANGPLSLNLAYRNNQVEGGTGFDDQQLRFSGFYKFGPAKVGLQLDRAERQAVAAGADVGADVARNAWSIPVSFGFGNSTILASFTKANDLSGVDDSGAKMYTLGYDYALSKRTNVGVYYSRLDNDTAGAYTPFLSGTTFTGSALVAGETASTLALGVKHTF